MTSPRAGLVQGALAGAGSGVWVLWRGIAGLPSAMSTLEPFGERRLARALADYMWRPLPTVLALAALTGVAAGVLCMTILKRFHVELAVTPPVARLITAQVAPLIVGIFAAGRISVGLAARFGAMQVQGETDALILQGKEPVRVLLGPLLASLILAAPVLTIGASLAAVSAAGAVLSLSATTPWSRYLQMVATPVVAQGVLMGMARSYVFLLLAVLAGAVAGTAPIVDLGDLEQRTMAAFNAGLLLIFTAFALLSIWK